MQVTATLGDTLTEESIGNPITDLWSKFTEDRSITKMQNTMDNLQLLKSYNDVKALLKSAGIPGNSLDFATAQVMFETAGLKSHVSQADNNFSGIKFINKPYQKATKGGVSPEGGNYAHFATPVAWANDFKRILSLGHNRPIDATDLRSYVDRLHENHYFQSNPDLYFRGLQVILSAHPQVQAIMDKGLEQAKNDKLGPLANIPMWGWGIIGTVAVIGVVKLVS